KTEDDRIKIEDDIDYVIIGAGTAGCIVATRLVEAGYKVFVLEAGRDAPNSTDTDRLSHHFYGTSVSWNYTTEAQEHALFSRHEHKISIYAGKLMGGSGSINAMIFLRGSRHDYDKWEEMGATGWRYETILPYLKKVEKSYLTNVDQDKHGQDGKIKISNQESQNDPLMKSFIEAVN
ncbi:glucose dehydrogenase-like [FAD: quinone], partial [Leptotrombidium deliense]